MNNDYWEAVFYEYLIQFGVFGEVFLRQLG